MGRLGIPARVFRAGLESEYQNRPTSRYPADWTLRLATTWTVPLYTHTAAPISGPRAVTFGVAANSGPSVYVSSTAGRVLMSQKTGHTDRT